MLNSILQFLDEDQSDAVIIAATNHTELLDPALFRRFDATIEYELPEKAQLREVFEKALFAFDLTNVSWNAVEDAAQGFSQADLVRVAEDAARTAVLENDAQFTTPIMLRALGERGSTQPKRSSD